MAGFQTGMVDGDGGFASCLGPRVDMVEEKKIAKGISNKPLSHQATERYRRLLILLEKRDLEKSPRKLEFK